MNRVLLNVKRFRQKPAECSVAAAASLANFFDPTIKYTKVRKIIEDECNEGLFTSQQARLLNKLGFKNVTIVTADLNLIDFSWSKLSKKSLISKMRQLRVYYRKKKNYELYEYVNDMVKWMEDSECNNNLIIDYEFKKYIKKYLNKGIPVGAAVNWTSLFKFKKWNKKNGNMKEGEEEDHSIVIRGYDEFGVFVVDSHFRYYYGKRAKYKKGYYKLPWEKFLVNIPGGDLILLS